MGLILALLNHLRPAPWQRARALLHRIERTAAVGGFLVLVVGMPWVLQDTQDGWKVLGVMLVGAGLLALSYHVRFGRYEEYEVLAKLYEGREDAPPVKAHFNHRWEFELVCWALDEAAWSKTKQQALTAHVKPRARAPDRARKL